MNNYKPALTHHCILKTLPLLVTLPGLFFPQHFQYIVHLPFFNKVYSDYYLILQSDILEYQIEYLNTLFYLLYSTYSFYVISHLEYIMFFIYWFYLYFRLSIVSEIEAQWGQGSLFIFSGFWPIILNRYLIYSFNSCYFSSECLKIPNTSIGHLNHTSCLSLSLLDNVPCLFCQKKWLKMFKTQSNYFYELTMKIKCGVFDYIKLIFLGRLYVRQLWVMSTQSVLS